MPPRDDLCYDDVRGRCPRGASCPHAHRFAALANLRCWVVFDRNPGVTAAGLQKLLGDHACHPGFKAYKSREGPLVRFGDPEHAQFALAHYTAAPYNATPLTGLTLLHDLQPFLPEPEPLPVQAPPAAIAVEANTALSHPSHAPAAQPSPAPPPEDAPAASSSAEVPASAGAETVEEGDDLLPSASPRPPPAAPTPAGPAPPAPGVTGAAPRRPARAVKGRLQGGVRDFGVARRKPVVAAAEAKAGADGEEALADGVAVLQDMGVTDKGACVQLLKKFDGDVDRVINEVLIHMDSPQTLNLLVNPEKRGDGGPALPRPGWKDTLGSWANLFGLNFAHGQDLKEVDTRPACSGPARSSVLTPSKLPCLSDIVTLNVAAGCLHRCVYCYAGCYETARVRALQRLPHRVEAELQAARQLPANVYFSPTCDAFQPNDEVQDVTRDIISAVFRRSDTIHISFLTKGIIRDDTWELLRQHPGRVYAQVGLNSVDQALLDRIEPGAASAAERLQQIAKLVAAGIRTTVRMDPLFPGITDTKENLEHTFQAIAARGVRDVTVSYLFLRPHIRRSLVARHDDGFAEMLALYSQGTTSVQFHEESTPIQVPLTAWRARKFKFITRLAQQHGLTPHLCRCKNSDMADIEELVPACSGCQIAGPQAGCHGGSGP